MKTAEIINILMACDKNYAPYYGVLLTSLFENNRDSQFNIHWISDQSVPLSVKNRFSNLVAKYDSQLYMYEIDNSKLTDLYQYGHINYAAYFHLNMANILPNSVHRIIYMDGDIIVNGNIRPLWNTDLEDKACAMVVGPMWLEPQVYDRLGYDSSFGYYNNGVVLYNVDVLRKINFSKNAMDYIQTHRDKLDLMDQDTENALLYDKIVRLPVKYNFQIKLFWESHWKEYTKSFKNELLEAARNPTIIHYSDRRKPWQLVYSGMPYAKIWNKYYRQSDWYGIKAIGAPLNKYCKHVVKRIIKPSLIVSNFIPNVYDYLEK